MSVNYVSSRFLEKRPGARRELPSKSRRRRLGAGRKGPAPNFRLRHPALFGPLRAVPRSQAGGRVEKSRHPSFASGTQLRSGFSTLPPANPSTADLLIRRTRLWRTATGPARHVSLPCRPGLSAIQLAFTYSTWGYGPQPQDSSKL